MICGNCKTQGSFVSVEHVKACYAGQTIQAAVLEGCPKHPGYHACADLHMSTPALPEPVTEEGIYFTGGFYYKVVMNQAGTNLYAKEWDGSQWQYAAGAMKILSASDRVTAEQAKAWGDLTHHCVFCSRPLTNDDPGCSVERGYGPVCAEREGLPWGA